MNRGGFSWNRLLGITRVKSRISRTIGTPLMKSGRERKLGRIVTGGGCALRILTALVLALLCGVFSAYI